MNRYETVLRKNVAANLLRLSSKGFDSTLNKSALTTFEKRLTYMSYLKTADIAEAVNRFFSYSQNTAQWKKITADAKEKIHPKDRDKAGRQILVSQNEITKAKNWNSETPTKNLISSAKISLIRDWLSKIENYQKYYSVALDLDERFFSVIDFLTEDKGPEVDLQKRKSEIVANSSQMISGRYTLIRRSLNNKEMFVKCNFKFSANAIGRHSYEYSGSILRNDTRLDVRGEGFCLYSSACFTLTGRYTVSVENRGATMIDHYVLHDDADNSVIEGIWNTIYIGQREPRAVPVVLLKTADYAFLADIPNFGQFKKLPDVVTRRLRRAKSYFLK